MRTTLYTLGLVIMTMIMSFDTIAQNLDKVVVGIKTANAKELAQYFGSSVDITIVDVEDSYRKAQAEMVVRDFFSKNPPTEFIIVHQGSSNQGSSYAIGSFDSKNGKFRTYIHYKESGDELVIHEIRFERD